MKVINKGYRLETKHIKCLGCNAELEIESGDEYVGTWGVPCVRCPECGEENPVQDERTVAPILNQTFLDHGAKHGATHVEDEKVQEMIDRVYQYLIKGKIGDYYCTSTGDALVFGTKTEDEITIYVTRDWKEDITCFLSKEF